MEVSVKSVPHPSWRDAAGRGGHAGSNGQGNETGICRVETRHQAYAIIGKIPRRLRLLRLRRADKGW